MSLRAESLPRRWAELLLWALLLTTPLLASARDVVMPSEAASGGSPPTGLPSRGGQTAPSGWPDLASSSASELLAPWLSCSSPADFVLLQQGVDMPRLVERLEDWKAVRLGALGPVREDAAVLLNRKRAHFLVQATEEYGVARAEVFALFILHSAYDDDVKEMLVFLARDKHLGQTLGLMPTVREELVRRGLKLSDTPDRDFKWSDLARGMMRAGADILDSSPARDGGKGFSLFLLREELPSPYQKALDEVEEALNQGRLSSGNVALGGFDHLTFGVPLGFYNLAVGTGHGLYSLSQGEYEQAIRELTPAVLMLTLHAGGQSSRVVPEGRGAGVAESLGVERLAPMARRLSTLKQLARQLESSLGVEGMRAVAREIQTRREVGRFVAVGGEDAVLALYEARGDVAQAQVLMSRARPETGPSQVRSGEGRGSGKGASRAWGRAVERPESLASLADPAAGLTPEVLEARLAAVELEAEGPRLPRDVRVLEKQRPSLDAPPAEARDNPRWREYVEYYERRLGEVREGKASKGPLRWESYEQLRGWFSRGMLFESKMVERLRADAELPRAQRRFLKDFDKPRIERSVGVMKPGAGLRFADVLVIEEGELNGRTPRVETFSFKSRNLALLKEAALIAQIAEDAREASWKYGETLSVRRDSLQQLFRQGGEVPVRRVRLIYEGGELTPQVTSVWTEVLDTIKLAVPGVEVSIQ